MGTLQWAFLMSALILYSDLSNRLVVPINPLWLKIVHVESCLVSVHCPELLTQYKALHKAPCLQLKHSVLILGSREENKVTYCAQPSHMCQVQAKEKMP